MPNIGQQHIPVYLTTAEQSIVEKRGFYVKHLVGLTDLFYNLPILFLVHGVSSGLSILIWGMIVMIFGPIQYIVPISIFIGHIPSIVLTIRSLIFYSFLGKLFYNKNGIYTQGSYSDTGHILRIFDKVIFLGASERLSDDKKGIFEQACIHGIRSKIDKGNVSLSKDYNNIVIPKYILPLVLTPCIICSIYFLYFVDFGYNTFLQQYISIISGIIFMLYGTAICLNICINSLHPLYSFGNLGEKIQNYTEDLTQQSNQIMREFSGNTNFNNLHKNFELFSRTFSKIITLLIKLEKQEKVINKGNIFDGEQYINSIRDDIKNPLLELQQFLIEKKDLLIKGSLEFTNTIQDRKPDIHGIDLMQKTRAISINGNIDTNIKIIQTMLTKI